MTIFRRFNKGSLVSLILLASVASFLAGLFAVLAFQSKYILKDNIEDAISEAERLSTFDKSITPERALKLFSGNLKFALFNNSCTSFYITDLLLHPESCKKRDSRFLWYKIITPNNNAYILGFSYQLSLTEYIKTYQLILATTIVTYLLFILFLTFIFFRFFIKNPITKITNTIDLLLRTKHFDINTFDNNTSTLLSSLYSSVSRLIKEVVKFKQEEEKLIISRQISHDLRAPISVLEERFKASDSNSIEYLALKRLRDITNELMPSHNDFGNKVINLSLLLNELRLVYPQISFHFNESIEERSDQTLTISETDLYRFLSNIIKNSIEASSKNIHIEIRRNDLSLEISLHDDGEGIDSKKSLAILDGHSSKDSGNGLGISSIQKKLQTVGGSVDIDTSLQNGFKINLQIPFLTWVLIDDDKLVRINWGMVARKKGLKLVCFSSIKDLLQKISDIPVTAHIYIDSDLGDGIKGEIESKRISELGFSNIYLATGYNKSDFDLSLFPWIKGVASKAPPF